MSEEILYDPRFQNIFIAFMLRDPLFLDHVASDIKPEIFTNEYSQRLVRLIIDFYTREKSAPGDLVWRILDDLKEQQLIPKSVYDNLNTYTDDLFAISLQNRNYVLNEFDRFIRHMIFRKNIFPAVEMVKAGKFDEAEELIKQTFTHRPKKEHDLGRLLEVDPMVRVRRRNEEDTQRFWWLVPEIDRRVRGLKRGELMVLQSQRSSGGKSAAMAFLARQYAFQNKRILIYSLEMSEEDYEDRLDMCCCGLADYALTDYARIHKMMRKVARYGGQFWIKQFPGQITTVSDLRKHKQQLEQIHNFHADVVIVDYADELTVERKSRSNNSFEAGKEIYSLLRGWAVKDAIGMITGMQSNRGAEDAVVADMGHAGESIAKAWIADVIVSINRDKKETEENITRLHFVKVRTGKARFTITVKTDFERMQFIVPERYDV
jgi:replicative DNA helicase